MNIVIIEDEILAAEDLSRMLMSYNAEIKIMAILDSVKDALAFFNNYPKVDVIFADIQLGDGLSFEIFQAFKLSAPIVFCTAFDEYALEAIRSNGIGYLLKPFTKATVTAAIQKYISYKQHFNAAIDYEWLIQTITGNRANDATTNALLIYHKDKVLPVRFEDIAMIFIDGEITRLLCFNSKSYNISHSLDESEKLAGPQFFRVNRQYLLNRKAIIDATFYVPRKYIVNLSMPHKDAIVVSKNRTTAFLQWLAGR